MKKTTLFIIAFISIIGMASAQKEKINGSWLVTEVKTEGKVLNPYMVTDFTEDGKMVIMGMEVGTWDYNKKSNEIVMKSDFDKDFNGNGKIINLTKKELILEKDEAKITYQKLNIEEITTSNNNSGLIGMWELIIDTHSKTYLTFKNPDEFKVVQKGEYSQSTINGTWIFNKKDMSLIMIGFRGENMPVGKSTVIKLNDDGFELENNGKVFIASKKASSNKKIERLTFSQDDFFTEDGDFKYEADEEKLPWKSLYESEMKMSLANVTQLVYNCATLIDGTEIFENKTLTANVKASIEEEINIDNVFVGFDKYNLPEDSGFPPNTDYTNPLYPLEGYTFRFVGNEQITTPAGTFNCTVLEVLSGSDVLKKLWMVDDKFGVYAKIIEDNPDEMFGHYYVYELQEIK